MECCGCQGSAMHCTVVLKKKTRHCAYKIQHVWSLPFILIILFIDLQDRFRCNLGNKNDLVDSFRRYHFNSDSVIMCQGICSLYLGYAASFFLNLNYLHLFSYFLSVCVMPWCAYRGQQVTCGSPFSLYHVSSRDGTQTLRLGDTCL